MYTTAQGVHIKKVNDTRDEDRKVMLGAVVLRGAKHLEKHRNVVVIIMPVDFSRCSFA